MFAIQSGEMFWGPFKTANEAAKWAEKRLSKGTRWVIRPLGSVR